MSIWTGSSDNSLVQLQDLEQSRVLTKADERYMRSENDPEYIVSVDVARSERQRSATTAIAVIKLTPRGDGTYIKHLVNLETYGGAMHFKEQSIYLKELVEKYQASMLVVDGNGLGRGLLDYLVQEDKYPSYSVVNDDGSYEKYKLPNSLPLIFNVMSNTTETNSSDIHNHFMATVANHDLKLLVSEHEIKESSNEKNPERLAKEMMPFVETSLFIDEVMNLTYESTGHNRTRVRKVSSQMDMDRYSAVSYGLYYVYLKESKNQQRQRERIIDPSQFMAVSRPNYKVFD